MTPELSILINQKEDDVEVAIAEDSVESADEKTPLISSKKIKSYNNDVI